MQIKTIVKYHYTRGRIARIQNADNTKCWRRCGTTGTCWTAIAGEIALQMGNDK